MYLITWLLSLYGFLRRLSVNQELLNDFISDLTFFFQINICYDFFCFTYKNSYYGPKSKF